MIYIHDNEISLVYHIFVSFYNGNMVGSLFDTGK